MTSQISEIPHHDSLCAILQPYLSRGFYSSYEVLGLCHKANEYIVQYIKSRLDLIYNDDISPLLTEEGREISRKLYVSNMGNLSRYVFFEIHFPDPLNQAIYGWQQIKSVKIPLKLIVPILSVKVDINHKENLISGLVFDLSLVFTLAAADKVEIVLFFVETPNGFSFDELMSKEYQPNTSVSPSNLYYFIEYLKLHSGFKINILKYQEDMSNFPLDFANLI